MASDFILLSFVFAFLTLASCGVKQNPSPWLPGTESRFDITNPIQPSEKSPQVTPTPIGPTELEEKRN